MDFLFCKIRAANLFEDETGDTNSRRQVFEKFFPNERFKNFSPSHYNDDAEIDMQALVKRDNAKEKSLRSTRLNKPKEMMSFILEVAVDNALDTLSADPAQH
jgi:hypothetical protein